MLIAPVSLTEVAQAAWIHERTNLAHLGEAIAAALRQTYAEDAVLGLSIGHLYQNSRRQDRGAPCVLGDWEADHADALAHVIAGALTGS